MTENGQLSAEEPKGELLVYKGEEGKIKLEVRLHNETVWLTQKMMAELFQVGVNTINYHIKEIYECGELDRQATIRKFRIVRSEGNRRVVRQIDFYNLDMIISVGYRVKSLIATRFRIWATERLKEYIVKGFTMDDERLKNPPVAGSFAPDYFDEMLERIRDIRASERRMYLRVREIFAMAADYEPSLPETTRFFSIIQNKLHYATTGMTAAELITKRADHMQSNMGLTSWRGDEVRITDVIIAKNYLKEHEIDELNRIVVMWLDYAEDQARLRKRIFINDWERKLDDFLRFNERQVLPHAGTVSKQEADDHARAEYEEFSARRRKYKEAIGDEETIKQLEAAAKLLPEHRRGRKK
ncbi:Uncharacterized protein clustered with Type I restriction-modification system [Olavius algarvensis Delta 1 endosymbiont]|nr:Uncharacterized protein clustered with Type I restriction-modification system [Olavius algarvensis Delta 1 endosymbiont]